MTPQQAKTGEAKPHTATCYVHIDSEEGTKILHFMPCSTYMGSILRLYDCERDESIEVSQDDLIAWIESRTTEGH